MPRRQRVERGLLEGLVRHGANAHLSAFETLPKNLRLMYVHAWRPGVFCFFLLEPLVWFGLRRAAVRDFAPRAKAFTSWHSRGRTTLTIELDSEFTVITTLGTSRAVSYTHLRAHETDSYLVCRLLLEKKN